MTTYTRTEDVPKTVTQSVRAEKMELRESYEDVPFGRTVVSASKEMSVTQVAFKQEVVHEAQKTVLEPETFYQTVQQKTEYRTEPKSEQGMYEVKPREAILDRPQYPREHQGPMLESEMKSKSMAQEIVFKHEVSQETVQYPKQYHEVEMKAEVKGDDKVQRSVLEPGDVHKVIGQQAEYTPEPREERYGIKAQEMVLEKREIPKAEYKVETKVEAKTEYKVEDRAQKTITKQEAVFETDSPKPQEYIKDKEYTQQHKKAELKTEIKSETVAQVRQAGRQETLQHPEQFYKDEPKATVRVDSKPEPPKQGVVQQEFTQKTREYQTEYKAEPREESRYEVKSQEIVQEKREVWRQPQEATHETVEYPKETVEAPEKGRFDGGEQTAKIDKHAPIEKQREQTVPKKTISDSDYQKRHVQAKESPKKKEDKETKKKVSPKEHVAYKPEPPVSGKEEVERETPEARPTPSEVARKGESPKDKALPKAPHDEIGSVKGRAEVEETKKTQEQTAPMKGICAGNCFAETNSTLLFSSSFLFPFYDHHHHPHHSILFS